MKRLTEVRSVIGGGLRPRLELPESAVAMRGFQPALLDVATMRLYAWDSHLARPTTSGTVIAGYERRGFFYTRGEALRACKEWGLGV